MGGRADVPTDQLRLVALNASEYAASSSLTDKQASRAILIVIVRDLAVPLTIYICP